MSLWRTTAYEPAFAREITLVVALPDVQPGEARPFPAYMLLADAPSEADSLVRKYPLEAMLCRERGAAAVCLPGWVAEHAGGYQYLNEALPTWLEALFPIRVQAIYRYAQILERDGIIE
ncbi:MAG: hypothetical protein LBM74_04790 [Oscillospiraceae bacterium]|jgi:hypothetical protein|nr:hypothetical protein [Oscillospiraceae bacterium]